MRISDNFDSVLDHMHCPCCNSFEYCPKFIKRVQILRDLVDEKFYLDKKGGGFYRCRSYNDSLKDDKGNRLSPKNSQHLLGKAMDISSHGWSGNTKFFFVQQAIALDLSIGIYSNWFHVDLREGPGSPVLFHGS